MKPRSAKNKGKRLQNKVRDSILEKFETNTELIQGQSFKKLELPEKGKQSYQVIKRLKLDLYYRKFIMSEMSLVRIRPIDFDSLI